MKKLLLTLPILSVFLFGCGQTVQTGTKEEEIPVNLPDIVFLKKIWYNEYSDSENESLITFWDKNGNYYSTTDTEICRLSFPELVECFNQDSERFEKHPQTCDVGELKENYQKVLDVMENGGFELFYPDSFPDVEHDDYVIGMLYYDDSDNGNLNSVLIRDYDCDTTNSETINEVYNWYCNSIRLDSGQTETTAPISNITIEPLEYQSMGGSLYYTEELLHQKARDVDEDRILRCMKTICDYFSQHYDYDILIANFNYDSENNLVFNGYGMVNGVKINDIFFSVDMNDMEMDEDIYFQRNDFNHDKIQLDDIISPSAMLGIALPFAEEHKDEMIDSFSSEKDIPIEGIYFLEYNSENGLVYHVGLGTNGWYDSYILIDANTGEVKDSYFWDGVIID